MKINHQRKLIDESLDKYRSWLDAIPDEQFDLTPPNGGWSYAEVYSHILQAGYGSLIAAEKCSLKTGQFTNKGTNALGWLVLAAGFFRRLRLKPRLSWQLWLKK